MADDVKEKKQSLYSKTLEEYEAKEHYKKYGGGLLPVWLRAWISIIFKWAIVIGFIAALIILPFTNVGSSILSKAAIITGPVLDRVSGLWQTKVSEIQSQITGVGEWKNSQAVGRTEKKGVEIQQISSLKDTFLPKDKISILGTGIAYALEKRSTTVDFSCFIQKEGEWIEGKITSEPLSLRPGENRRFDVACDFDEYGSDFGSVIYPDVRFVALYRNFLTNGTLRLYTMSKEELNKLGSINPFNKEGFVDHLLDKTDRVTRSSYDYGPLKISMGVSNMQPLSESQTYLLKVNAETDKANWLGNLTGGLFRLIYPKEIIIFADDARSSLCTKPLKLGPEGITLFCDFTLSKIAQGLSWINIDTGVVYDFEFSKIDRVIIAKEGLSEMEVAELQKQVVEEKT